MWGSFSYNDTDLKQSMVGDLPLHHTDFIHEQTPTQKDRERV